MEAKTTTDYLVDVLADIPYFLQLLTTKCRCFPGANPENQPCCKLAKAQLPQLLNRLKDLHHAWEAQYRDSYWPVTPSPRSPSAGDEEMKSMPPPFEKVLHFTDVQRADDFCLFNVALLLVLLLLEDAGEPQLVSKFLQDMFPKIENCSIQNIANLICSSADYLLLDKHGSLGYILWTFPLLLPTFSWTRICRKPNMSSTSLLAMLPAAVSALVILYSRSNSVGYVDGWLQGTPSTASRTPKSGDASLDA